MVEPSEWRAASQTLPRAPSGVPGVWLSGLVEPSARGLVATCPSSAPASPGPLEGAAALTPFVGRLGLGNLPARKPPLPLTSSVIQQRCGYPSSNECVFTQSTLMLVTLNRI